MPDRDRFIMYIIGCEDIADVAGRIQKLVPDVNVAYAHGQMREHEAGKDHV